MLYQCVVLTDFNFIQLFPKRYLYTIMNDENLEKRVQTQYQDIEIFYIKYLDVPILQN